MQVSKVNESFLIKDSAFANAHLGIAIFDADSNKYLYEYQGDKFFVPASNTKILTCYAAMKYLGDSLPGIKYRVVNDSTIIVSPTGDPTFLNPLFHNQPVAQLLSHYKYVQMNVGQYTLSALYGNGWSWNDYNDDYMAAKTIFPIYGGLAHVSLITGGNNVKIFPPNLNKIILDDDHYNGIKVSHSFEGNNFTVSAGKKTNVVIPFYPSVKDVDAMLEDSLGVKIIHTSIVGNPEHIVYSQPTDSLLKQMMFESDNFIAEQCLTMIGVNVLKTKYDQQSIDTILKNNLAGLPQHPHWVDGCGMSRYNLFSPIDMVYVLKQLKDSFGEARVNTIFPVGNKGTLKNYYISNSNNIHAKTGSMSGVFCISGYITTLNNRHLIFSVMVNNHQSKGEDIRHKIEAYLEGWINNN